MNHREIIEWVGARETSVEVATLIDEIAADDAEMQRIWESPTLDEFGRVVGELSRMVRAGLIEAGSSFYWGQEKITV